MLKCLSIGGVQLLRQINWSAFVRLKERASSMILKQHVHLHDFQNLTASYHTSTTLYGLEEFFENKELRGERIIKHGRAWSAEELRQKDNADLHKLWYVLLKERNMLLTLDHESERLEEFMPSPERLEKVEESMDALEAIVDERNAAVNELETGYKDGKPGRWIRSPLGYKRYVPAREHFVPHHVNKKMARKRNYYQPWTKHYRKLYFEIVAKERKQAQTRERNRIRKLKKRFPNADID